VTHLLKGICCCVAVGSGGFQDASHNLLSAVAAVTCGLLQQAAAKDAADEAEDRLKEARHNVVGDVG